MHIGALCGGGDIVMMMMVLAVVVVRFHRSFYSDIQYTFFFLPTHRWQYLFIFWLVAIYIDLLGAKSLYTTLTVERFANDRATNEEICQPTLITHLIAYNYVVNLFICGKQNKHRLASIGFLQAFVICVRVWLIKEMRNAYIWLLIMSYWLSMYSMYNRWFMVVYVEWFIR